MRPQFHPTLVNGPCGDPAVLVDFLHVRRAFLFDLGDISRLAPRKVLRISHVFVSHAHMDHMVGFDYLLRLSLGREKTIHLFGPAGFIDRIGHHLSAYTWNLLGNFSACCTIVAGELHENGTLIAAPFPCRNGFTRGEEVRTSSSGLLLDEESLQVRAAVLDHGTPCLAFLLEEKTHVNIKKNKLDQLGLPVGPWLSRLRFAVIRNEPAESPFHVAWEQAGRVVERRFTLEELQREVVSVVPGQKIAYVTDTLASPGNLEKIMNLARNADYLFIEAPFLQADLERARRSHHLTATQAGAIARGAGAVRVIPFHFSPRYQGNEQRLREELCREI